MYMYGHAACYSVDPFFHVYKKTYYYAETNLNKMPTVAGLHGCCFKWKCFLAAKHGMNACHSVINGNCRGGDYVMRGMGNGNDMVFLHERV